MIGIVCAASWMCAAGAFAQESASNQESDQQPPAIDVTVDVVGTAPLPGVERPADEVAAPVQTAKTEDLRARGSADVSDFLNRRFAGVHVNEIQGNPFQADLNFRGYTASPLLGTPQGLSVYMDGVRMNQPFGEVVSWDLIPEVAIATSTLMPGSNPLFGLNTLGGAIVIQTKTGRSDPGTAVQAEYGSHARRSMEVEHGGSSGAGLDWYFAGTLFADDGWRDESPSDVRQAFGTLGWTREHMALTLTAAFANNALIGNGLQEFRLLQRDYAGVYTTPDITDTQSTLVGAQLRQALGARASLSANVYYRHIGTDTVNGDLNDDVLEGDAGPDDNLLYPGILNTTGTVQHNYGGSAQVTATGAWFGSPNDFTAGGAWDGSRVHFDQGGEFGYLTADRAVIGSGVEAEDAAVDLRGRIHTWSAYATDTWSIGGRWHATVSGRFNRTAVHNRDGLEPGGGPGSLDGDHVFSRLNPAAGLTFTPARGGVNVYAGYSEGSRAATAIELGCADPDNPCRLPNAIAGDPPLRQVVARTWEAGVRKLGGRRLRWNAGVFRAENDDDILFVSSGQTGYGYFKNFGQTRRQGVELGVDATAGRATLGASYTSLDATFQTGEIVNGGSNSTQGEAGAGDEQIRIAVGDRLPLIPRHVTKVSGDVAATDRVTLDADLVGASGVFARGNENNRHEPDGVDFLGAGSTDGYVVVNAGARVRLTRWLQAIVHVTNVFDRRYATAAQLGPTAFTPEGEFAPQMIEHSTFVAPGAPRLFWVGTRVTF